MRSLFARSGARHVTIAIAVVLVGPEQEEWNFPTSLLPDQAQVETTLILGPSGSSLEILGIRMMSPSVESRLHRDLFQRRPISVPLPRRETALTSSPENRPSRMLRTIASDRRR